MYDAIVVGARCAGAPTAMLLARKGYRVLLVDRATFPSDTFRSHVIMYPGVRQLQRWGLFDEVVASNCPPIRRVIQDMGDFPLVGNLPAADGVDALYAPRRKYLDHILVKAAVAAGVTLWEGFSVQELLWDGDRVSGIRGTTTAGTSLTATAPMVIGADGVHSFVARSVEAAIYNVRPVLTWAYYSYWSGTDISQVEFYRHDDVAMLCFPTNDGLAGVAAFGPIEGFHAFRADIGGSFDRTLGAFPQLTDRVRRGQREERWLGTADLPNFFRKPYGAGWALVGDAGYHRDPVTGTGISEAFRDAELLAEAIDAGFSGRQRLSDALASYEEQRNAMAFPSYEATIQAATFGPLPGELLALRAALRANQADADRFVGVMVGAVSPMEFYAPENIGRIMSAGLVGVA
jgi:2-polyprenyl-6-methoxyphenol hydroxylase-like FAD-dependent oxidoreductase